MGKRRKKGTETSKKGGIKNAVKTCGGKKTMQSQRIKR